MLEELDFRTQYRIRDFKEHGMPVKVVPITDWDIVDDASDLESYALWLVNYELAIRRIVYIFVSVLFVAAAVLCWIYAPIQSDLVIAAVILTAANIIPLFAVPFWRRQLNGFKYFCELKGLPMFSGFARFLFGLARFIGFLYVIVGIVFQFILIIITNRGDGFNFYDRLGILENIGEDKLISLGIAADEETATENMEAFEKLLDDVDYAISKYSIETDYQYNLGKIENARKQVEEYEKENTELSFEEKEKIAKMKEKINSAQEKLDKNYKEAKDSLESNFSEE